MVKLNFKSGFCIQDFRMPATSDKILLNIVLAERHLPHYHRKCVESIIVDLGTNILEHFYNVM